MTTRRSFLARLAAIFATPKAAAALAPAPAKAPVVRDGYPALPRYEYIATRPATIPSGPITHAQLLALGFVVAEWCRPLPPTLVEGYDYPARNNHAPLHVPPESTLTIMPPTLSGY